MSNPIILDPALLAPQRITLRPAQGDDPEAWVLLRPIGVKAWRAAQRAAGKAIRAAGSDALSPEDLEGVGDEMSRALIKVGLIEWGGIGGPDGATIAPGQDVEELGEDGAVIAVHPGTISLLLADPFHFHTLDDAYVMPFIAREQEKNGSAPSSTGTSAGATQDKAIASSSATPIAADGATGATISSTSRKPKKAA